MKAQDFWISGINVLEALLQYSPERILELKALEPSPHSRQAQLLAQAQSIGLQAQIVPPQRIERYFTPETNTQGLAARITPPEFANSKMLAQQIAQPGSMQLVILDGVTDPHNLGACARTAVAAGAAGIIVPKHGSAPLSLAAYRASAGLLSLLPVYRVVNLKRTMESLKQHQFWLYAAARRQSSADYSQVDYAPRRVLALGAEGRGLREQVQSYCDVSIHIGMQAQVESLNVSVACGILLFEIRRQLTHQDADKQLYRHTSTPL